MKVNEPVVAKVLLLVRSHQGKGDALCRPLRLPIEVLNDLTWSEETLPGADMLLLHKCFSPLEVNLLIS